jgi:hypothetical protein
MYCTLALTFPPSLRQLEVGRKNAVPQECGHMSASQERKLTGGKNALID